MAPSLRSKQLEEQRLSTQFVGHGLMRYFNDCSMSSSIEVHTDCPGFSSALNLPTKPEGRMTMIWESFNKWSIYRWPSTGCKLEAHLVGRTWAKVTISMENHISTNVAEAFRFIHERLPQSLRKPVVGIICGSGLGGLAESVLPHPRHEIRYADIPNFPQTTGDVAKRHDPGSSTSIDAQ